MLSQVYAFKVSTYNIDRSNGYNCLISEIIENNYYKAILTRRQLLSKISLERKDNFNIVIDKIILLK